MEAGCEYAQSFTLPNASVAIGVWDAPGHTKAAAADAILVCAGLRALLHVNGDIVQTMTALNRVLVRRVESNLPWHFVSGFFGMVNPADRTLQYVSCGHDAAILFRGTGEHVHLAHTSPHLGLTEEAEFVQRTIDLAGGDALVIVTDGVTKARPAHAQAEYFGTSGTCSLFQSRVESDAADADWFMNGVVARSSDGMLHNDAAVLIAHFA